MPSTRRTCGRRSSSASPSARWRLPAIDASAEPPRTVKSSPERMTGRPPIVRGTEHEVRRRECAQLAVRRRTRRRRPTCRFRESCRHRRSRRSARESSVCRIRAGARLCRGRPSRAASASRRRSSSISSAPAHRYLGILASGSGERAHDPARRAERNAGGGRIGAQRFAYGGDDARARARRRHPPTSGSRGRRRRPFPAPRRRRRPA